MNLIIKREFSITFLLMIVVELFPDNMFVDLGAEYFSCSLKIKNIKTSK
jgi:hypothetical protein